MTKARDLADLLDASGNIIAQGTIDGRDLASDGSKLDGIESGATADQTHSEIRALIVDGVDTNVFTDADHTKLDGIEANATADQTASEIRALVESATDSNVFTDADHTKLNAIESGATADQTKADIDALNINADTLDGQHGSYYTGYTDTAVANLVDSAPGTLDTLNELAAALGDDPNFATTVTNSIATKLPLAGGTMTGDITFVAGQTFDGRDVSVDGTKLDGIEAGATGDQTASEIRALVEAATDSNVFTDADHSKLNAVEANAKDDQTITAGSGLTGGGTGNVTLSHSDTSSQGTVNNSGATVVQDVTLDTYGHVTGLGSHTLTLANLGYTGATNANYITNNNQLTNGSGYTTNVGDITNVTAGTNLTGGGSSGSVTVNLTASPNITSLNVGGTEVISNSRALNNIASVDATTAAAIGAAGVGGGGTVDLTADGSISSGDVVGVSGSGTVATTAALFGPKTSFATANRDFLVSYWDQSANKVVVLGSQSGSIYVRVGTIASNGTITWGTEASYNHGGTINHISVAMHNNVIVGSFMVSNYGNYLMMQSWGVSGTTISSTSGLQYLDGSNQYYGGSNNVQNLMADPNNSGKFVQAYTGGGSSYPRAACITATGSSCTSNTVQVTGSAGPSYFFQCLAYNPTSGKFMGTWVENGNIVTACRLEVSGSSISVGTPIITNLPQSNDIASMAYSSANGNFLYFVRDGGRLYGWVINTASNGNATSFGGANLIYTGSGSDFQVRYTYNSSNATTVGAWKMGDGSSNFLILSDTAAGVITVDGDPIDVSDTASTSMNYGGPWGMQGKGSFVSFDGNNSPRYSSEINTASTYFTAIGISEGNYSNGQTATITIPGGVTNTISGLTPGEYYTPSSSSVGGLEGGGAFAQALATNKLLLK